MIEPGPISAGGSGAREAVDRGESTGCLPTTAWSWIATSAPRTVSGWTSAAAKRLRQPLERAHDHGAVACHLTAVAVAGDEPQEVLALEPQRLVGLDLRDVNVAR